MMYTKTVTMCKARHLRNYIAQEVGYNVDFTFDYDKDEVRATFTCSDDFADPNLRHTSEDLEEYIIKRYGAFLIKENQPTPKNFPMDMKKIGEILTNPNLKGSHKDSYQDEYKLVISRPEWMQLKSDIKDITYERMFPNHDFHERYILRLGLWHG